MRGFYVFSCLAFGAVVASLGFGVANNQKDICSDSYSLRQISTLANIIEPSVDVTGFENKIFVEVEGSDKTATFYDFNGNEGYMLLGDDFTLLDYKFDIDADNEIKLADCVLFNEVSKTYKVRKNDKIIDVVDEREIKRKNTNNLSSYSHGEGKIEANDLDNYVSNYFSGGILDESYSVPMKRHTQQDLSIYKKESVMFIQVKEIAGFVDLTTPFISSCLIANTKHRCFQTLKLIKPLSFILRQLKNRLLSAMRKGWGMRLITMEYHIFTQI